MQSNSRVSKTPGPLRAHLKQSKQYKVPEPLGTNNQNYGQHSDRTEPNVGNNGRSWQSKHSSAYNISPGPTSRPARPEDKTTDENAGNKRKQSRMQSKVSDRTLKL